MKNETFVYEDEEGLEHEVKLPGKYVVCSRCHGVGSHSRHIGCITAEQWQFEWSDDEKEAYIRGEYNMKCDVCDGNRVSWEVDLNALEKSNKQVYDIYINMLNSEREWSREIEREYLMMGGD